MGLLLAAGLSLMLTGAPPIHHAAAPLVQAAASPSETDLPPTTTRFNNTDVGGRLITYFSTACCGSMVCGGCLCIPMGLLFPLAAASAGSLQVIVVGALIGAAVAAVGLITSVGGLGGYAVVLVALHQMGLWDSDAAAQGCNDVLNLFSVCLSVL